MPTSSPDHVQDVLNPSAIPSPYRAEYNPLSARWMVLSKHDACMQAGLSKSAAIDYADKLNRN